MRILILGGGISALSAAFYARKKYPSSQITIVEKTDQLGGWMQTRFDQGFLFEKGPRTFAANRCPHLLDLMIEIGLQDQLIDSNPSAKNRFLWYRGKLRSPLSFLPMMIFPLLREPFIKKGFKEDESIYEFASRRLGKKITNTLIDAMTLGIYAGDIHQLSIRSCFPFLHKWEQERGSLLLGALSSMNFKKKKGGLFTLQKGMGTLAWRLAETSKAEVLFNAEVEEIRTDGAVANGIFYPADLVICALSGASAGKVSRLWPDFPEGDLGMVHLAFRGDVLPRKGFGYLVPSSEKANLLGMVWDSSVFPQQSHSGETRVTAIMRQASLEGAIGFMRRHLNVTAPPIFSSAHELKGAILKFHVGYGTRLAHFEEEMRKRYPSLILLGNYLRGASVDACIAHSKRSLK